MSQAVGMRHKFDIMITYLCILDEFALLVDICKIYTGCI